MVLTLSSCTNENFYSSSENNSKQEIISKSLWKEDTLFIKRIYDHFQKSFTPTEADQHKFVSEHGTPVWEYAMTMGFKRNQLFVPLVQNNQVIGVMRVQRQDKKAFYSFTKDDEALRFFDIVMYNRNLYKLQPQKDEKLNQNIYSKGSATWTCTKRSVITGYHMDGDVMVMETSFMDVCKYSYTTGKPRVDHLEVYTDGMEGGGGGDEGEEEQNEENPCDKAKAILADPAVQTKTSDLKEQSKIKEGQPGYGEKAFEANNDGTISGIIDGDEHMVKVGSTAGKQGVYHNHTPDGPKMFSPADILKMLHYALAQPIDDLSNGFLGMVGSEECNTCPGGYKYHNYIIRFSGNSEELVKYIYQTNWDKNNLKRTYEYNKNQLSQDLNYANYQYGPLNGSGLEKLFFDTLLDMGMEGKVNLQRIDENGTVQNITLNSNGTTNATPCP